MNEITANIIEAIKAQTPHFKGVHHYIGAREDGVVYWEEGPYQWTFSFPYGGIDQEFGTVLEDVSDLLHEDIEFVEADTSYSVYPVLLR